MSSSVPSTSAQDPTKLPTRPVNPWKNPSYPARIHWAEKPELEARLIAWERKLEEVARKLETLRGSANRGPHERIYHQMLGARDQLTEAVRRLPGEAGVLYHEDHERLVNAEEAFQRLLKKWESLKA